MECKSNRSSSAGHTTAAMLLGVTSGIEVPTSISALQCHCHIPVPAHLGSMSECLVPPFSLLPKFSEILRDTLPTQKVSSCWETRFESRMIQVAIFKPPCILQPPLDSIRTGQGIAGSFLVSRPAGSQDKPFPL